MRKSHHDQVRFLCLILIDLIGISGCSTPKTNNDKTKSISIGDVTIKAGVAYKTFGGYECDATITAVGTASGPLASYVLMAILRNPQEVETITDKQGNKWTSGHGSQMNLAIAWTGPLKTRKTTEAESVNWTSTYTMSFSKGQQFMITATLLGGETGNDWYAQATKTITPCK